MTTTTTFKPTMFPVIRVPGASVVLELVIKHAPALWEAGGAHPTTPTQLDAPAQLEHGNVVDKPRLAAIGGMNNYL